MRGAVGTWTLALATLLAVGCGGGPKTHYYLLEPQSAAAAVAERSSDVRVGIKAFRVDPPYDQDYIVYREGGESPEVGFYWYHRWAAPLARMLPRVVAAALNEAGDGARFEPQDSSREYDAHLRGRVLSFEEVDVPDEQRVRVRILLTLTDRDGEVLWSEPVEGRGAVQSKEVRDVVEEMTGAVHRAVAEAAGSMGSALARAR